MAVFPDVLGALESHVKGAPVLSALALAVFSVVALYNFLRSRRPDLSHIPILGAELGPDGRKAEYARNATAFLQRGYIEVPNSFYTYAQLIAHRVEDDQLLTRTRDSSTSKARLFRLKPARVRF